MDPREDRSLFTWFVIGLFGVLMMVVIVLIIAIFFSNDSVTIRLITLLSTMFSGVLGLGAGYFLGRAATTSKE